VKIIPVIFEDHTFAQFRPLSYSLPTYEMRVGMFNLRERVRHLSGKLNLDDGYLLSRSILGPLHPDTGWQVGAEALARADEQPDTIYLWLNGRLAPGHSDLGAVIEEVRERRFVGLKDQSGLLAMACDPQEHRELLRIWENWATGLEGSGTISDPTRCIPDCDLGKNPFAAGCRTASGNESLQWIWDIVPATSRLLEADRDHVAGGAAYLRQPFGIFPLAGEDDPLWSLPQKLEPLAEDAEGVFFLGGVRNVLVGPQVLLAPGVALDSRKGPIILEGHVQVMPGAFLEGPLFIGAGSTVKSGARLYGESSYGVVNKISGEIGESTFGDFSNKQHDGFIGHAVLGSWINLGAMTTCSDLKNNYGPVRVDLGSGARDTGRQFVGLLMGDHAKTAIGSLFNTGTCVGFATNIFGGGMPPKFVGNFQWGGMEGCPDYAVDKALETARVVMARRGCELLPAHENLFRELASG
jgi:UDP-N-acetylglucosamine diphosphorylase/glucosamine-1-phosphate N-acetyltransferase